MTGDITTRYPRWAQIGRALVALFFVLMFWPFIVKLFSADEVPVLPLGDVAASAVYPAPDGSLRMLRVMHDSTSEQDAFHILHNDLQAKQLLGDPQLLVLPRAGPPRSTKAAQMRTGTGDQIDLLLNERQWWRWNPQSRLFESMNEALTQRFALQLGTGVAQLAFGGQRAPDLLDVTSNTGDRYAVYWATGEIFRWGEPQQLLRTRPWAQYTDTAARIDYADFRTDVAQYGLPSMLVRYQQKVRAGEFQQLPLLTVRSTADQAVRANPERYQRVSDGFVIDQSSVQQAGITQIARVVSAPVQFSGQVLARNASHVLMRYEETPTTAAEVALQIVDATSLQVVWRKAARDMPQIVAGGGHIAAQALPGGFYLTTGRDAPALVIDNAGQTRFDFHPQAQEAP